MNLDDYQSFSQVDTRNMLGEIDNLPGQLESAWKLGQDLPLPAWENFRQVVIAGLGDSAIGADLLAAFILPACPVPLIVHRDYDLPAFACGPETLMIASSHSGNTEETLTAYERALASGCRCLAITTGGRLAQAARAADRPLWTFQHAGQPRAAVGFSFSLLLAVFTRLGLIPDPSQELAGAVADLRAQQQGLKAELPITRNLGKRQAGQLFGRWVAVFGAGRLALVARRWKCQINEIAKAWAQFESLPEADHNTLAGAENPEKALSQTVALFLESPSDHPRNHLRSQLTRQAMMLQGIATDSFQAKGNSSLSHQWTLLHLGDYIAYYLAMMYEVDPTPTEALNRFKEEMRKTG